MKKNPSKMDIPFLSRRLAAGVAWASLSLFAFAPAAPAASVKVEPKNSVIVLSADADDVKKEAAQELQKHLNLVTGDAIEIRTGGDVAAGEYPFYVGTPFSDDKEPLGLEDARWAVTPEAVYLYGNDDRANGSLFAVYEFLENQLGIRWVEPGDVGIGYEKQSPLILETGESRWTPQLVYRAIRQGLRKGQYHRPNGIPETDEFLIPDERHDAKVDDTVQWKNRMRMGGMRPGGGHAFSTWWKKYGKEHPDYFALNKFGKREPVPLPKKAQTDEFVKICPSNPEVAKQVIEDWLPKKDITASVDAGMNDGIENFCLCEDCLALDVPKEGEKPLTHLTDRYVFLANMVAREARKHRSDAYASMYAYLTTLYPPRKQKLEPNVLVQLVPYVDPLDIDVVKEHLEGWKNAGAKQLAFRPNYHPKYMTTVFPLGIEKQMFEVFQVAVANGAISADYDSLVENWPVTGVTDYILAHAMADPSKSFEYWEDHYCKGYGAAAGDVKDYFRFWRNEVWDKRLKPNISNIANAGGAGEFARGLQWNLEKYYRPSDFKEAAAILKRAAEKSLTPAEKDRVNQLRLANEHASLVYQAIVAKPEDKAEFAEQLMAFRKKHKDDLRLLWVAAIGGEINNGDLTGLRIADEMKEYQKPWLKTNLFWKFQIDPKNVGLKEKWQDKSWEDVSSWPEFRTDRFWEQQFEFDEPNNLPEELAREIFTYDGIAWYVTRHAVPTDWRDRQIFLRFGAVDESCQVFVNGKLAGERIFKGKNDWKTPFEIRIDPYIDWNREQQLITVRVEDQGGAGGLWRPVWVVSKEP